MPSKYNKINYFFRKACKYLHTFKHAFINDFKHEKKIQKHHGSPFLRLKECRGGLSATSKSTLPTEK